MPNFYITTTLPYVNDRPHIGHVLEFVQADAIARWRRLNGDRVIFNTGTDEHGQKVHAKAMEAGIDPQAYCDGLVEHFRGLKQAFGLSYTNFIRTTDEHHVQAAQEFWRRCAANGDIYKTRYETRYCVGCELEKTDSELVDGRCPVHPNLEIELRNEENYFFRWSKYGEALLNHYSAHPDFVVPATRLKEIESFVKGGLRDFSISRLASKMPWGIPVPGDGEHVMYVWFDALVNYISTLGWPEDKSDFAEFWPGVQVAGKDNLRQQSAMWQAMLLSAGLPMSRQVFIHGFITADGQKMSKSLGNVVDPLALVREYGTDPVRYYLLGGLPSYEDGDYSERQFEEFYGSHLANGIGNLTARIATMVGKYCDGKVPERTGDRFDTPKMREEYEAALSAYRFDEAVRTVSRYVTSINQAIDTEAPFRKAKEGIDVSPLMYQLSEALRQVGIALLPLIPDTATKILRQLNVEPASVSLPVAGNWGGLASGDPVVRGDILFPRLEK
ncbi:methionine--tRNA ligase [Candidatus Uhrbacteria bacterium]|nr:methionine--tRNA ligase [Candidatus Uhrbacteria bacterium]